MAYNPTFRETRCDNPSCNKLLNGYDRTAKVQIDHLEIKGSILTQRYTENGKNYWTYISEKPLEGQPPVVHAFCNSKCLSLLIEHREFVLEQNRKEAHVRWAREESDKDLAERHRYGQ